MKEDDRGSRFATSPATGPIALMALDLGGAVVAAALLVVVATGLTGPARVLLALAFVTFVPGWAVVGHVPVVDGMSRVALAAALSLTICTVATLAQVWLGVWRPTLLFDILAPLSLAALTRQVVTHPRRLRRSQLAAPAPPPSAVPAAPAAAPAPGAHFPATGRKIPARTTAVASVPAPVEVPASAAAPVAVPAHFPAPAVVPIPAVPSVPVAAAASSAAPRRPTVRPEDMTLVDVQVQVGFPLRSAFDANDVVDFYAQVHRRHQFEEFRRDGQLAFAMETDGVKELTMSRDQATYREAAIAGFDVIKDNLADVMQQLKDHFEVTGLANPSIRLRAVCHPDPSLVAFATVDVAARRSILVDGGGPLGIALHLSGQQAESPRHDWNLVVEPGEGEQVAVALTTDFALDVERPAVIGEFLQQCHDFLFDNVVGFFSSLVEAEGAR